MKNVDSDLSGMRRQIKSKERVANHGEVFTAEREVNAMLDLVRQETERVDSRFLEPACGTGNFLVKILERKLAVVRRRFNSCRTDYELNALIAAGSIYGIELLPDNATECRERLLKIFTDEYRTLYPTDEQSERYVNVIRFIFERNIIVGDALTLMTPDGSRPIVFSEWAAIGKDIKRRDFTLDMLLKNQPMEGNNLFSDLGDEAFIPEPIEEFNKVNYLNLADHENI
jgi:hypothetical protein